MTERQRPIFKISPPILDGICKRERLYRLLDGNPSQTVTWVCSPAGSGKTTLVADYAKHRNVLTLWYQIDQRDEDPAAFFYYMAMAVKQATPGKRKPLPLFTREHLLGLNTFALSYFEKAYERIGRPALVVIDNYQHIPPHSVLHQLIYNGLAVIPDGIRVIVISREEPPPAFSRMRVNRKMAVLDWPQIRLTEDETGAVVRLQTEKPLSRDVVRRLHDATDGWISGLVLMFTRLEDLSPQWPSLKTLSFQDITAYFNTEVFERESVEIGEFLLKAAFLPHMSVENAAALTGEKRAAGILEQLNRNHRFTEKRMEGTLSYRFHPLFREFLLQRADQTFGPRELADLQVRAARLIQKDGDMEEAAELLSAANDWNAIAQIITSQAFSLYEHGRYATILGWLNRLPQSMIHENPWLSYWQGSAMLPHDPGGSRIHLERAFEGFRDRKKESGMLMAWAEIIGAVYYAMSDYTVMDRWIEVMEKRLAENPRFPSEMIQARVTAAMFLALNCRKLHHPDIDKWAEKTLALLTRPIEINMKILLINNIALYHLYTGDIEKAAHAVTMLEKTAVSSTPMPLAILISTIVKANYFLVLGRHEACMEAIAGGLEKLKKDGLEVLEILVEGYGIWSALTHGHLPAARALLARKAPVYEYARPFEQRLFLNLMVLEAVGRNDVARAVSSARILMKTCEDVGAPFHIMTACLFNALVMHESRSHEQADEFINQAMASAASAKAGLITFCALMLKARFALDLGGRARCVPVLRKALALGRSMGIYNHVTDTHAHVSRLFALALEEGIEEDYARECIERLDLKPPVSSVQPENWPWPVKIHALGKFSLVLNGEEKVFTGRIKAKPLALLKALIACGGRDVPEEMLADILWPDADGDLAHTSFNTTLHRLRRILSHENVLQLQSGKLTLDPQRCWVDVLAFEAYAKTADDRKRKGDSKGAVPWLQKAMDLYGGPFLPGDAQAPWSLSMREKLKSRFLTVVMESARHCEQTGDHEKAAGLYQKGLAVDDLVEPFYQGLMLCLKRSGRSMEAAVVYQRCRKTLAAVLGINPSRQTELIFQSL